MKHTKETAKFDYIELKLVRKPIFGFSTEEFYAIPLTTKNIDAVQKLLGKKVV